ncbi:phosphatidylinositol mannoside acyltransferase [Demequina sp. SO4-18]|uniref:phosphatidylinositol mannoside acyltransferase n=1 Tax=Demequina sp. SO4-18 TaxID=3401026 RepID=UPI003B5B6581
MSAFLTAWRVSSRSPIAVTRAAASAVAWWAWATRAKPAARLEDNLHRVTGLEGRELRRLSRQGMASAARYYSEVLELGRMKHSQIDARARTENFEEVRELLEGDEPVVAVLSHCGNWDLVGAWGARNLTRITAVAEVLEPREVFDEFVAMRERVGIHVLGHEGGSTFRQLIQLGRGDRGLICLLADRDMSGRGVEVEMWGRPVKVAPGPAAVAAAARISVMPVMLHYERLRGARRRAAGSRWGVVMTFGPVIDPADFPKDSRVEQVSQAWAGWMAQQIARHPQDWHMLQRFGWVA